MKIQACCAQTRHFTFDLRRYETRLPLARNRTKIHTLGDKKTVGILVDETELGIVNEDEEAIQQLNLFLQVV